MAAVVAAGLTKRYGETEALRGIDLEIEDGEIFGLLGPNGAGKTTFVSILATLRSFEADTVSVCGLELPKQAQRVRETLGIVPQELAIYEEFSAWQNLAYFGGLYSLPRNVLHDRIEEALAAVGLAEQTKQRAGTFSGGMKRRLNLAAGLLHRPRLLLLDEPTVGVDPQSRNRIFEVIRQLNRDSGMTILYTTHYMEEAEGLCNRVAIVDHGSIVACDTVQRLLRDMGSTILQVEFEEGAQRVQSQLAQHESSFTTLSTADGVVRMETDTPEESLQTVLDIARQREVRVRDIQIHRRSLQEVFLKLTGRELRD